MKVDPMALDFALTRTIFGHVLGEAQASLLERLSDDDMSDLPKTPALFKLNGYYFEQAGGLVLAPSTCFIRLCVGRNWTISIYNISHYRVTLERYGHVMPRNSIVRHEEVAEAIRKSIPQMFTGELPQQPVRIGTTTTWEEARWFLMNDELYAQFPKLQWPVKIWNVDDFNRAKAIFASKTSA